MSWKAIYTKPRHEKKVADRLRSLGLDVFCPVRTCLRQWSDRKKKVKEPVFRSYVFLKCFEYEELMVLQTSGVLKFVRYLGKIATIRDHEIEAIKEFLSGYRHVNVKALEKVRIGEVAEIRDGFMKGRSGEIVGVDRQRARVIIAELGIQLTVQIPVAQLIKV